MSLKGNEIDGRYTCVKKNGSAGKMIAYHISTHVIAIFTCRANVYNLDSVPFTRGPIDLSTQLIYLHALND